MTPKISFVSSGRSQFTGPWNRSHWEGERGEEFAMAGGEVEEGQKGKGLTVREDEVEVGTAC